MRYKMIVTDLDGTLLHNDKKVSAYSQAIIKECVESGVKFVVSTGRILDSCKHILPLLPGGEIITCNGAEVYLNGERIYHCPMKRAAVKRAVSFARKYNIYTQVYIDNKIYTDALTDMSAMYSSHTGSKVNVTSIPLDEMMGEYSKIVLLCEPEDYADFLGKARAELGDCVKVVSSNIRFIELVDLNSGKEKTVKALAERYGIKREEIIAFGDGNNDALMLEFAGLGVAMENAFPDAKAKADMICEDNEHDGEAKILEKIVLKKTIIGG